MLLVLAPPLNNDIYYKGMDLIPFYKSFAMAVDGRDDVVIVADKVTAAACEKAGVPNHILLEDHIADPWIRDFSYVCPKQPVQFRYIGGDSKREAKYVQRVFNKFASKHGIEMDTSSFYLDGGNVVDNYFDKAIVTSKFLKDNGLSYAAAVSVLQEKLNVSKVSIITPDEDLLGHADGMVCFTGPNTILVNKYEDSFGSKLHNELHSSFPECAIIEVPAVFDNKVFKGGYASACGIYVNSIVTENFIYMPTYGLKEDTDARCIFEAHSCGKTVVPIDARLVGLMGGSLRCLSWQVTGLNAQKIRSALACDRMP